MKNSIFIMFFLSFFSIVNAEEYAFNESMLGFSEDQDIDLAKFEKKGYIYPGLYNMQLLVNDRFYDQSVDFQVNDVAGKIDVCLKENIIEKIPFSEEMQKKVDFNSNGCFETGTIPGFSYTVNLGQQKLELNIPQYYLQYSNESWDPPKLWSEGENGFIFDYALNMNQNNNISANKSFNAYAYGETGFNINAWRVRAEWQTNYQHTKDKKTNINTEQNDFTWNNIYAYRALKNLKADLLIGESYLNTDLFSSFNYTGASLVSDDEMLPPNLRNFAPEVTGVAQTNALVTVSQLGRTLYQTQVPAGAFNLRDLPNYVAGALDVKVEEQDGTVQNFQVDAIASPYLTRPGQLRYKATVGQPRVDHDLINKTFITGELSYGLNNKTSLFGGLLSSTKYHNANFGVGQDLDQFGAFSLGLMASHSPDQNGTGVAARLNYNKYFKNTRLSGSTTYYDHKYQEFSGYLNEASQYSRTSAVSLNQSFPLRALTVGLSYSESKISNSDQYTGVDNTKNQRFDLNINKYFNLANYKNINTSLNVYKTINVNDDYGAYLRVSFPMQTNGSLSYTANKGKGREYSSGWNYANRLNQATNYSVGVGHEGSTVTANTFLAHQASNAAMNVSAIYRDNEYFSVGAGIRGGFTATKQGMDLHRVNTMGGTRIMVDTDDVADIPLRGYGIPTYSNVFGIAVTPDVRNYYRNNLSIDLNKLPNNADALDSVKAISVTKGAIGYQRFAITSGEKGMVRLVLPNAKFPQFGAEVYNDKGVITGIVGESGVTYLTGMAAGRQMKIENNNCSFTIPKDFSVNTENNQFVCQ